MRRVVTARPLEDYRIDLIFDEGTRGVADLSSLAGRGVFALWNDYESFKKVRVVETGEIAWGDEVDLCPDSLYLRVTGKKPEDVFPALNRGTHGNRGKNGILFN